MREASSYTPPLRVAPIRPQGKPHGDREEDSGYGQWCWKWRLWATKPRQREAGKRGRRRETWRQWPREVSTQRLPLTNMLPDAMVIWLSAPLSGIGDAPHIRLRREVKLTSYACGWWMERAPNQRPQPPNIEARGLDMEPPSWIMATRGRMATLLECHFGPKSSYWRSVWRSGQYDDSTGVALRIIEKLED